MARQGGHTAKCLAQGSMASQALVTSLLTGLQEEG